MWFSNELNDVPFFRSSFLPNAHTKKNKQTPKRTIEQVLVCVCVCERMKERNPVADWIPCTMYYTFRFIPYIKFIDFYAQLFPNSTPDTCMRIRMAHIFSTLDGLHAAAFGSHNDLSMIIGMKLICVHCGFVYRNSEQWILAKCWRNLNVILADFAHYRHTVGRTIHIWRKWMERKTFEWDSTLIGNPDELLHYIPGAYHIRFAV